MSVTPEQAVRVMRPAALKYARKLSLSNTSLFDDLVQEGFIGAMNAARTFNPALGWKFNSYAKRRVYGAMVDYLRDHEDHLSRTHRRELGEDAPVVLSLNVPAGHTDTGEELSSFIEGPDVWAEYEIRQQERDILDAAGRMPPAIRLSVLNSLGMIQTVREADQCKRLRVNAGILSDVRKRALVEVARAVGVVSASGAANGLRNG